MSSTKLVEFRNGVADDCTEFRNSWGGAARIWDSIWKAYGTNTHEFDNWLSAATDGRLWGLWASSDFIESEKIVYLFTCDNALVEKKDFSKIAAALREFESLHPCKGVSHLSAWADLIESSDSEAIGLHATSVTENPWFEWDEETDETLPYNLNEGDKHWFVMDRMQEDAN